MKAAKWIISGVIIFILIFGTVQVAWLDKDVSKLREQLEEQSSGLDVLPGTRNAFGRLDALRNLDDYWLARVGVGTNNWNAKVSDYWDSVEGIQTNAEIDWFFVNSRDAYRYPSMSFYTSWPDLSVQPNGCTVKIGFLARGMDQIVLEEGYNHSLGFHALSFRTGAHYSNHFTQCLPSDWRTEVYKWSIVVLPWGAEAYCDDVLVCRVYNLPQGNSEQVSAWTDVYPPRHLVWMNGYSWPPQPAYQHAYIEFSYTGVGVNCKLPLLPWQMSIMSSEGQAPKSYTLMKMSIPAGVKTELKDCLPVAPCKDLGLTVRAIYPRSASAGGEATIYCSPTPYPYVEYWDTKEVEPARTLEFAANSQKAESWKPSIPNYHVAKVCIENKDSDAGTSVCTCDAAWDTEQGGSVVCSADTGDKKESTASAKMVVGADAAIGDLASEVIASTNISTKQVVVFWIKTSIEVERGDLQIKIGNTYFDILGEFQEAWDEHGNHTPHHDDCFGLDKDTWYKQVIRLDDPSQYSGVISIGIKQTVDLGAFTLHIDDIKASRAMEVTVNATLL